MIWAATLCFAKTFQRSDASGSSETPTVTMRPGCDRASRTSASSLGRSRMALRTNRRVTASRGFAKMS